MRVSAGLEQSISQMLASGRLLERVAHDEGPWHAVAYGCGAHPFALTREVVLDGSQIVFSGYLSETCNDVWAVGVFIRSQLITARILLDKASSPCRITMAFGVSDAEMAA